MNDPKQESRYRTNDQASQSRKFSDWMNATDAPLLTLDQRQFDRGSVEMTKANLADGFSVPATPDLVVILATDGNRSSRHRLETDFSKMHVYPWKGQFLCFPANSPTDIGGDGTYEFSTLAVPWSFIQSRLEPVVVRPLRHLGPKTYAWSVYEVRMWNLIQRAWGLSANAVAVDRLERVELERVELGNSAVALLAELSGFMQVEPECGSFQSAELNEAMEFNEQSFPQAIGLQDLANVVSVSCSQFSRLFKNTIVLSPIEYMLQKSTERAKSIRRVSSDRPLTAVAADYGFADQSHLSRHFKPVVSPTRQRGTNQHRFFLADALGCAGSQTASVQLRLPNGQWACPLPDPSDTT